MPRLLLVLFVVGLGACAPAGIVSTPAGHPASAAVASAMTLEANALPPAAQPELPAVLQREATTPQHQPTAHTAADHARPATTETDDLQATLDAYLAIHKALTSDRFEGVAAQAQALAAALAVLTEAPPEADPHFWHMRAEEVAAVQAEASALRTAEDLTAARAAFGRLSVPLAGWIEALGVPEGYDVARFVCGMYKNAPEGGVWLQPKGDVQNPYFGSAMPMCGTHAPSEGLKHKKQEHKHHGGTPNGSH